MAITPSAKAPNTKAPTVVDLPIAIVDPLVLVLVRWPFPMHESPHRGMIARIAQLPWRAPRDRGFRLRVQENAIITNVQQTGQFVTDDDHRHAETVAQIQDQIIEAFGGDRIQT